MVTARPTHPPVVRQGSPAPPKIPPVAQGNEKGPPSPQDLGYYSSQMADVNLNSEKGPQTAGMGYMPEQYQYLQAQVGAPGKVISCLLLPTEQTDDVCLLVS